MATTTKKTATTKRPAAKKTSATKKTTAAKAPAKKTAAAKKTTTAKKTTAAKKPSTARKTTTAAKKTATGTSLKLTATEKKLVELYRDASATTKKEAMEVLKADKKPNDSLIEAVLANKDLNLDSHISRSSRPRG